VTKDKQIITDSGIEIEPVYDAPEHPPVLPPPGVYPYTRGVYPTMYRGRRWTMRYGGPGDFGRRHTRSRSDLVHRVGSPNKR